MNIKTITTTTVDFSLEDLKQILVNILVGRGDITSGECRIEEITEPGEYNYDDRYPSPDVFKGLRIINEKTN